MGFMSFEEHRRERVRRQQMTAECCKRLIDSLHPPSNGH
jgi:hypothetical protein